ncbi:MAG: hypothetical protein GWN80_11465, partial [Gammaproteobacteria bacterium]|nr:hypothetical protein [Gammaproteobacteria bacterium]
VRNQNDALFDDKILIRRWDSIPNKFLEDIAEDVRARRTESNPEADLKEFTGTWRIVRVDIVRGDESRPSDRMGSLVETLAFGFQ